MSDRSIREAVVRRIIYTTWDENWFQVKKPSQDWYSELDQWFRANGNNPAVQNWQAGIDFLQDNLDSSLIKSRESLGLAGHSSPLWYIGDLV